MSSKSLNKTISVLRELQTINPQVPLQGALIFLRIAAKPGVSLRELEQLTQQPKSSVHRWAHHLATATDHRKALIGLTPDPLEPRRMAAHLSFEGARLLRNIEDLLSK